MSDPVNVFRGEKSTLKDISVIYSTILLRFIGRIIDWQSQAAKQTLWLMDIPLLTQLCAVLDINLTQLDFDTSFIQNGGDSLKAVALAATLKSVGCEVSREAILTSQSLRHIFHMVQMQNGSDAAQQLQQPLQSIFSISPNPRISSVSATSTISQTFVNGVPRSILEIRASDTRWSSSTGSTSPSNRFWDTGNSSF